mmetsp:Transcript_72177/g.168947  ORF Transcript_72177/g.168947 Transcript_72177/m.168947 type:complete len:212 (-) Transcript_72177:286-921(-)
MVWGHAGPFLRAGRLLWPEKFRPAFAKEHVVHARDHTRHLHLHDAGQLGLSLHCFRRKSLSVRLTMRVEFSPLFQNLPGPVLAGHRLQRPQFEAAQACGMPVALLARLPSTSKLADEHLLTSRRSMQARGCLALARYPVNAPAGVVPNTWPFPPAACRKSWWQSSGRIHFGRTFWIASHWNWTQRSWMGGLAVTSTCVAATHQIHPDASPY